jgi:hypothetical protein
MATDRHIVHLLDQFLKLWSSVTCQVVHGGSPGGQQAALEEKALKNFCQMLNK